MSDSMKKAATSAYLRRNMPKSSEYNPVKAAKIFNRFETPIKKSYEEMDEAKPQYLRMKKAHGGKISTAEQKNPKHKNCW